MTLKYRGIKQLIFHAFCIILMYANMHSDGTIQLMGLWIYPNIKTHRKQYSLPRNIWGFNYRTRSITCEWIYKKLLHLLLSNKPWIRCTWLRIRVVAQTRIGSPQSIFDCTYALFVSRSWTDIEISLRNEAWIWSSITTSFLRHRIKHLACMQVV